MTNETLTITAEQILKSKKGFSEFMEKTPEFITSTLASYPKADGKAIFQIAELTQNNETFAKLLSDPMLENLEQPPFIVWSITNPKEEVMQQIRTINKYATSGFGIFVFRAFLNEDRIDFECLLKPNAKVKKAPRERSTTKTNELQKEYWDKYFEVCDGMGMGDFQIDPAPQHFANISIGKTGAYIKQTVSVREKYIASEIFISSDKSIFEKLYEHKEEIEEKTGALVWLNLEKNACSTIRLVSENRDITDKETQAQNAEEHVKMAELLKEAVSQYI